MEYDPKKIEPKWQQKWDSDRTYAADLDAPGEKDYLLVEFPYPSGEGLHIGHVRPYTAMDTIARKRRMEGKNVLYPMGWDAFGLPTENYAIKTGIHPIEITKKNTANFKRQIQALGMSFDWDREVNTSHPEYYKWTQWIFLLLHKRGLAYKDKININWCLSCKVGLANEEVIDGKCERCGGETEKREKEQWMLAITKYADRLVDDLETVDYLERIKAGQRNWIGRSYGAEIDFQIKDAGKKISVFTTRPDTLFGATYMVLAPEHELVVELQDSISNIDEVRKYIQETSKKTEIDRTAEGKEKTGVLLEGIKAINPANNAEVPVFIADYVLAQYGTGAIMAVPAHDERDNEFATKFDLPIIEVIDHQTDETVYTGAGILKNSGDFDGEDNEQAKEKITKEVGGEMKTTFKLRDWVFSRQRYWGEPIPMVHCEKDGWVPLPESELPLELPMVDKYEPTDDGESPLSTITDWVNTSCPECGGPAKRETDTMPTWAGSSWYFLRYMDPNNSEAFVGKEALDSWKQVQWYNGGMEHTTLHLLYSRFWYKVLFDEGLVPNNEPYAKRTSHGLILAEGGEKMSKSKGNVINPDDMIERFGADTLRTYEMFMGPFDQPIPWSTDSMVGVRRFIERVCRASGLATDEKSSSDVEFAIHGAIKKVTEDIETMKFNTAVSTLMKLVNTIEEAKSINNDDYKTLLKLLAPFAPHVSEELWEKMGETETIHRSSWPVYDPQKLIQNEVEIVVQINGKVRAKLPMPTDSDQDAVLEKALDLAKIQEYATRDSISKVIYVDNKLINIVSRA